MNKFLSDDFLLSNETAKRLYHDIAEAQPIIDYHCHVSPKEIFENKSFRSITEIWLGGDHYKWRLMRSHGIDEYYITGNASDYEKFEKFAEVLPYAVGNPMYVWCHLELKRYFGFEGNLSPSTCREVYELAEKKLTSGKFCVRDIIRESRVKFIGTTDDPIDTLEYHKLLREDETFSEKTVVAPSFRPDKALNLEKAGYAAYIGMLSEASGIAIQTVADLKAALEKRLLFFKANGCKAADHGLDCFVFESPVGYDLDGIFRKAQSGKSLTDAETEAFKTELLLFCAALYHREDIVMQIHYNCLRNPNTEMFKALGADTGFDSVGPAPSSRKVADFLNVLFQKDALPKTVLYSLDAGDNAFLDSIIGAFQGKGIRGKLQHGAAWWFNDTRVGMTAQLTSFAELSILGNFIGMLTDSRSFLSYTRHEYFRRILCAFLGELVEKGEYPDDFDRLSEIVKGISYDNALRYFSL